MAILAYLGSNRFLLALGLLAAACLLLTPVAVLAAISIIGLPITLIMAAIPTIFLVALTARIILGALAAIGIRSPMLALVLALGVLAIVPSHVNGWLNGRAADLVWPDLPQLAERPRLATLAVRVEDKPRGRDVSGCDDLCLRALLSGNVERFLAVHDADVTIAPALSDKALSFRLEQRPRCPPVTLQNGGGIALSTERPRVNAAERMRLSLARGLCLIEEESSLSEADAVISLGRVARGVTPFAAGLDPFADTVRAWRLEVHRATGLDFGAVYRRTHVTVARLAPILAPSYVSGYGLELRPGLLRLEGGVTAGSPPEGKPDLAAFAAGTLGLDLALPPAPAAPAASEVLAAALAQAGPLDAAALDVTVDFFAGFSRAGTVDPEDQALAIRLLADERVPVNRYAWALVKQTKQEEALDRIAAILFDRLRRTDPALRDREQSYHGYPAAYIATAIAALPAGTIRPHRAALEWLARERELRVPAWDALKQLSVFGGETVDTMLFLIDDAGDPRAGRERFGNAWQHPYLAGLIGLCLAGRDAAAAAGPLIARLRAGKLVTHASYGDLLINTLVSLGADPEDVWSALAFPPDKPDARRHFDQQVKRALKRADCTY